MADINPEYDFREWLVDIAICGMLGSWPPDLFHLSTETLILLAMAIRRVDRTRIKEMRL
jgi:hypothetical protein